MNTQTMMRPEFEQRKQDGGVQMMTMEGRDLTGCSIRMPDLKGGTWFHAIVRERIKDDVYRFDVIQLGGKYVDAEIIANVRELAAASVA